jgi:DNA-binding transcriptional MerR regulator
MAKRRPKPAATTRTSQPLAVPSKPYFKIGEVAEILGVATSVLRFWETEFPSVRPAKSRTNQRVYERRHVERLLAIKTLVHEQGYTLAGARKKLREDGAERVASERLEDRARAEAVAIVRELLQLCDE